MPPTVRSRRGAMQPKTNRSRPAPPRPWRSRIPKGELIKHLADGRSYAAIGRMYETDHSTILRLLPQLSQEDLLQIVKARPVVQVPTVPIRSLRAVDMPEEMMRVLDRLHAWRDFWESPQAEVSCPDPARRMMLSLQVMDRIQRFMPEFLALQAKLSEWTGYDLWRDEILQVLDEVAPGAREKLLQRVTAKVFVERGPDAARAAVRALDPVITPDQVPPSLRSMLASPASAPPASDSSASSPATSLPTGPAPG